MSTTIKSFDVSNPAETSLLGFALANPNLTYIEEDRIFYRSTDKSKVALISGGGAGHEPTHAGFIGSGMLSAAVVGDIFASPSTKQILNAIKVINANSNGVLLIVKNYTGDVLHFGLSAERARALGINCEVAIVGDDVAVGRTKGGMVGRRALAGTVLVHKIVGAFAEHYSEKYGLNGAARVARIVNDSLVSIGSSLDHCKVPGRTFETELKANEMELGMGIHNEPGVEILSPIPSTEELIEKQMLPKLLDPNDKERYFVDFHASDEVVLLINNLGSVSNFMLSSIASITISLLKEKYGIVPKQTIVGTVMTAFNGNGFSITLLNASKSSTELKREFPEINSVLDLLGSFTDASAWPVSTTLQYERAPSLNSELLNDEVQVKSVGNYDPEIFAKWMHAAAKRVIDAEPHITSLDLQVGDGDCGYTLVNGVNGILDALPNLPKDSLSKAVSMISDVIESAMGGTSGGLYSILISGFSQGIMENCKDSDEPVTKDIVAEALVTAINTLYKYTRARPGSSTIMDALVPFVEEFKKSKDFRKAVKAAEQGAKSTAKLEAKFGRASYVGESSTVEDPGAVGLVEFLKGILSVYE